MTPKIMKNNKTYKRETAWISLLCLLGVVVYALTGETPDMVKARGSVAGLVAMPVFLFTGAAFGMDWVNKQTAYGTDYSNTDSQYGYEDEGYNGR